MFDDSSFAELASAHLLPDEAGLSILVSGLGEEEAAEGAAGSSVGGLGGGGGGGYIVVGTAHILPDEPEPTSGRILVFELQEGYASSCTNLGRTSAAPRPHLGRTKAALRPH